MAETIMRKASGHRLVVGTALLLAIMPIIAAPPAVKTEYFRGKVVPLAKVLEQQSVQLDADAVPHWFALVTDEGTIYPLVKDDGSRMFAKDPRLLDRPMRLTGRLIPGSQLLQVLEVHSFKKGQLHQVYYWCDVCAIKRYEKKICECCGGPMELREEPVTK
jgi:hypothetical protein